MVQQSLLLEIVPIRLLSTLLHFNGPGKAESGCSLVIL
jgi:hypothetical protein